MNSDQKVLKFTLYLRKHGKNKYLISNYSLTNIFKVVNKGLKSYYNICSTLNFKNLDKIPSLNYTLYSVRSKDTWTNISFKTYGTILAWWIICKFNNIKNPFLLLKLLTIIKLPTSLFIDNILLVLE